VKGVFGLKFMQRALEKRREEAKQVLKDMERAEEAQNGQTLDDNDENDTTKANANDTNDEVTTGENGKVIKSAPTNDATKAKRLKPPSQQAADEAAAKAAANIVNGNGDNSDDESNALQHDRERDAHQAAVLAEEKKGRRTFAQNSKKGKGSTKSSEQTHSKLGLAPGSSIRVDAPIAIDAPKSTKSGLFELTAFPQSDGPYNFTPTPSFLTLLA
jgi:hypothetical protein